MKEVIVVITTPEQEHCVRVHSLEPHECSCIYMYMYISNEIREGRNKEASKVKQNHKAMQHSTPKSVTFPKKYELGLEPTILHAHAYIHVYNIM